MDDPDTALANAKKQHPPGSESKKATDESVPKVTATTGPGICSLLYDSFGAPWNYAEPREVSEKSAMRDAEKKDPEKKDTEEKDQQKHGTKKDWCWEEWDCEPDTCCEIFYFRIQELEEFRQIKARLDRFVV